MNACEELLIHSDLREVFGKPAPDLVERTLARLRGPKAAPLKEEAIMHALPSLRWQRFALAASVLLALALIGWLAWPRALPEGVSASGGASYTVRAEFIELREGALLLQTGAPEVRVAGQRVNKVDGRAVVRAGGVPEDLAVLDELPLTDKEKPMLKEIKRWTVAAGVALCVLSGSALLNDQLVEAKDEALEKVETPTPKPEDLKGVRELLATTRSVTIRGRDANFRMCCPVEITEATAVKELVDAIYSNDGLAAAPAGWDSNNQITFHLAGGEEIQVMVNIADGLADLKLKGWERYYEYNARTDLLKRFQRPLDLSLTYGPDCPAPQGLRKLRGWSGPDSRIEKREFAWAMNDAVFKEVWERHAPGVKLPAIDFNREMVIGIFMGKRLNSREVELVEILQDELSKSDEFTIRFDDIGYSEDKTPGDATTSFGIFVLSKTDAVLYLEQDVQLLSEKPRLWSRTQLTMDSRLPKARSALPAISRLRGWEGEGSGVKEARNALIESKAAWEALWKEHKPGEAAPEVDFDKEQVVAIFQSVPAGWGGVKITDILANNARTVLHVRGTTYQTEGKEPTLTMAYGFHVFPKGVKLVLETPNYASMDAPPRWLETAWK